MTINISPTHWHATEDGTHIRDANQRTIAHILTPGDHDVVARATEEDRGVRRNNARLMAAAPRLLLALNNLVGWFDEHPEAHDPEDLFGAAQKALLSATEEPEPRALLEDVDLNEIEQVYAARGPVAGLAMEIAKSKSALTLAEGAKS